MLNHLRMSDWEEFVFSFAFSWNISTTNRRMNAFFFGLLLAIIHLVSAQGKVVNPWK